jgi:hypothetical protein
LVKVALERVIIVGQALILVDFESFHLGLILKVEMLVDSTVGEI